MLPNATFDHDSEKSVTGEECPILRESLYRSKSEYESTAEKQHYDSYKDFLTHQNSLELSLNFKDTISAPIQLEPKEIIPPLTSQNQTQKKLDYETSSSSL